jgi:hypothetical protein
MDDKFQLNRLAVHYIDKKNQNLEIAKSEQNVQDLDPVVVDFINKLINEVWAAEDKGRVNSANFTQSDPSLQLTHQQVALIKSDENCFFQASVKLAHHLYAKSPGSASAGLLGVVRLVRSGTHDVMIALLKIQVKNEKFVKLRSATLTQMTVEDVENLLLEDIQKGAIYPHPERPKYDLKVIDKQMPNDAARYFSERFLGCKPKQSDEHQVKRLIPTLEAFAEKTGTTLINEKLPKLIVDLRKQGADITTSLVAQIVEEDDILDGNFDRKDFIDFVRDEGELGEIDITKKSFDRRGTGERYIPREFSFEFTDPKYRGVKITGSAEILEGIRTSDGDTVTFTIRTTCNGFKVKYE